MDSRSMLVIAGGGLAGAKAAEGARAAGHEGPILLVGEESQLPYERPPLSKGLLRGEADIYSARVHDETFYDDHDVEVVTGERVERLDLGERRARLAGGRTISYAAAVIATGAAPRRLGIPNENLDGVHYLRTVADAIQLREAIGRARRVAVIGAGWIGAEVAASARQMGAEVLLVDPAPTPLHRVLGTQVGRVFADVHTGHGVDVRMGVGVGALQGKGTVTAVVLSDGRVEECDAVVVGVGVTPRDDLARVSGLQVENGVLVDDHLRAGVPTVFAAGDVANAWHGHYGRHLRVEHWANALNQGLAAGRNAIGPGEAYVRLPYFYSDQFELGMEYVGHADAGDDVVIRGDLAAREFIAFYHQDGLLNAAAAVNVWDVVDEIKPLIEARQPLDVQRLADPSVPLPQAVGARG